LKREALSLCSSRKIRRTRGQPAHRIGVNAILLHLGHLPAVSSKTGLVKCFTYRHSLHPHRVERVSCDCSMWVNAFDAKSRIASRAAFSVLSVESTNSIPSVEVCEPICAISATKYGVIASSCSHEHILLRASLSRTFNCCSPGVTSDSILRSKKERERVSDSPAMISAPRVCPKCGGEIPADAPEVSEPVTSAHAHARARKPNYRPAEVVGSEALRAGQVQSTGKAFCSKCASARVCS
jgi:hypothetical protein